MKTAKLATLAAVLLSLGCQPAEIPDTVAEDMAPAPDSEAIMTARPDLSGIWGGAPGTDHGRSVLMAMEMPFTPEGRAAFEDYDQSQDPAVNCAIDYGRTTGSAVLPMELLQTENIVYVLYEYEHQIRRIFIRGRSEATQQPPSYMGSSVGWWEGDTLVVEVSNLHPGFIFSGGYGPYSEELLVTERFTLSDDGQRLTVARNLDDPKFYTEPIDWSTRYEPAGPIFPYECELREHLASPL